MRYRMCSLGLREGGGSVISVLCLGVGMGMSFFLCVADSFHETQLPESLVQITPYQMESASLNNCRLFVSCLVCTFPEGRELAAACSGANVSWKDQLLFSLITDKSFAFLFSG